MKFNKWTVALAGLGVVSLASAAKAEETVANSLLTAVAATSFSGYVDTSAQWNIGTGNTRLPDYKFGGPSKADGFNLNVVQLRIEKPLDEQQWSAGYRIDLWAGPDANTLGTQSFSHEAGTGADFAIRQAYVLLQIPVPIGPGIECKVGVFDSIIGYESVESPSNPNYTRSYGHSIEPQTHTGILASCRVVPALKLSFGIANTMGPSINARAFGEDGKAESAKTYMGSVELTAPDSLGFMAGSTLYGGVVTGLNENESRSDYDRNSSSYYAGFTLATPVVGLRAGGSLDVLDVANTSGETWAVAGYLSYMFPDSKLSVHGRAEYLRDRGAQKFFTTDATTPFSSTNPDRVLALTGTVQYDLWKNVISRLEVRWDHSLSGERSWGPTTTAPGPFGVITGPEHGTLKNEVMVAANIIYRF